MIDYKKDIGRYLHIIPYEEYKPATITIAGYSNTSIDIMKVAEFLPVHHIFEEETDERLKLKSGSRKRIEYMGKEKIFVSICYKHIRRGVRLGVMSNMASLDVQLGGKNIHLKLSSNSITSVGTKTIENGRIVFGVVSDAIKDLQEDINFLSSIEKSKMRKYINEFIDLTYVRGKGLVRKSEFLEILKDIDLTGKRKKRKVFKIFSRYINDFDFDEQPELINKIIALTKAGNLFSGEILEYRDVTIYNSVFHITPIKTKKKFKMPLYLLAPFFVSQRLMTSYHNWKSEGINVCVESLEKKPGTNHSHKEYKHRFVIQQTGRIRQCSPSSRKEAYGNYLGIMGLLKKFFENPDISFEQYIYDRDKVKINKMEKFVNKSLKKRN